MDADLPAILHRLPVSLPEFARLSGVNLETLRSLSSGRRMDARPATRKKIADGIRKHARQLLTDADLLDPPTDPTP